MAGTATGTQNARSKSRFVAQWMVVTTTIAISYVAVTRIIDAGRRIVMPVRAATANEVNAHCAEFILLAQAKYADDWKFRLDPRDIVCAGQVQAEWERQSAAKKPRAPETSSRPTFVDNGITTVPVSDVPVDGDAARARNPETYCLNMMSLARTKYGPEWKSKVAASEAAGCETAISAASN
ncbi:MAG: hypothetical protein ABL973_03595 [Micropepsaceae bacterium]